MSSSANLLSKLQGLFKSFDQSTCAVLGPIAAPPDAPAPPCAELAVALACAAFATRTAACVASATCSKAVWIIDGPIAVSKFLKIAQATPGNCIATHNQSLQTTDGTTAQSMYDTAPDTNWKSLRNAPHQSQKKKCLHPNQKKISLHQALQKIPEPSAKAKGRKGQTTPVYGEAPPR